MVHELGHSFAGLADEYYYPYTGESINKTQNSNPATIRWKNWLTDNSAGIYPFAEDPTWFRPSQTCEMRQLLSEFCPVCKEGIIEQIHDMVSIVDSYTPANSSALNGDSNIAFSVAEVLPIPNTLTNKWILNGTQLPNTTNT